MKHTALTAAIAALMLAAAPAFAQVTLGNNPDAAMVRAESTQNQCAWLYGTQSNIQEAEQIYGRNVDCVIEPLSVPVYVGPEGGMIRVCYAIYGNAMSATHDGAVAWVDGPDGAKIADYALAPSALDTFTDSTTISSCADIEVRGPESFTLQVHAAWDTANRAQGFREQWGGYSPKTGVPSHLTAEIVH